jgi:hypothetical protein
MVLLSPLINQAGMYKCPDAIRAFVDFIGDASLLAAIPYRKILKQIYIP